MKTTALASEKLIATRIDGSVKTTIEATTKHAKLYRVPENTGK